VAEDFCRQAAVVLEARGDVRDIVFSLDDRFPAVEGFELGQHGAFLTDTVGESEKDAAALLRGGLGPRAGIECGASGLDRALNVFGVRVRNLGDDLLGRGIVHGEGASLAGRNMLSVDDHRIAFHETPSTWAG
jgi:hypothetical protein